MIIDILTGYYLFPSVCLIIISRNDDAEFNEIEVNTL